MSGIARATLFTGRKSASSLELARIGRGDARNDPPGRDRRHDITLLERLEAENRKLRNQASQLALQIQALRRLGKSDPPSTGSHARKWGRPPGSQGSGAGSPTAASRRRPVRSP